MNRALRYGAPVLGLAAALWLGAFANATATAPAKLQESLSLGEHWYGPKITAKDLLGKVVLYEVWGKN